MWEDIKLDLRRDIQSITVPMTVLYNSNGDGTQALDRYATDYSAKTDAKLIPVKNTGHFIQLDQPEIVRAAIIAAAR